MSSLRSYKDELMQGSVPLGDAVKKLSLRAMEGYQDVPFGRELANGALPKDECTRYFASVTPVVFSFNQALATTIPATDTMRERELRRELMQHMREEDKHNLMYWDFLRALGVDHLAIYDAFAAYARNPSTHAISHLLHRPDEDCECKLFRTDFPDSVAALSLYLTLEVGGPGLSLTSKLAGLTLIELMLYDAVSQIYSGLQRIIRDDVALKWFTEHSMPDVGELPNTEQKHLDCGITRLNQRGENQKESSRRDALRVASEAATLFRLVLMDHYRFIRTFSVDKYRAQ